MPIHFDRARMAEVLAAHEAWWTGKLDRPLVQLRIPDAYPAPDAGAPLTQADCTDLTRSPEDIIDAWDAVLSRTEYLGDAYPQVNLDVFGPGVLAAFCGARLDNSSGRVWFFPEAEKPLSQIRAVYDPDNIWARRIKDICRAGVRRWEGNVIIGMPDLGGILDAAASLAGTENLLYALADEPEEVERLTGELHRAWHEAYRDFAAVLSPQGGYTDWSGLLSGEPSYILQCDFCYMIGPEMFRRFVLETLRADTRRLSHTIYHLDGVGELVHLDDILLLDDLDAVQWVCGAGKPDAGHWLDVYRRIAAAGKRYMVVGGPRDFLDVLHGVGGTPYARLSLPAERRDEAAALLAAR